MLDNLMGKINEAQKKMEETKKKLDNLTVDEEMEGIRIKVTGNREIKNIELPDNFFQNFEKDEAEDLLLTVINRAIQKANDMHDNEMQQTTNGMLSGLPGLF